jgi:hypothetical protein
MGGEATTEAADAVAPVRGGAGYGNLQRIINETGEIPKKEV